MAALELEVGYYVKKLRHLMMKMGTPSLLAAEKRWGRIGALHLVAWVQAGVKFQDGQRQVSRPVTFTRDLLAPGTNSEHPPTRPVGY